MRERWQRAQPALAPTPEAVAAMVREGLPQARVVGHAAVEGGLANTNIRVDLAEGRVLLRLYQHDPAQAPKEAALAKRLAGTVPVARYLHSGTFDGQRFALVEWIEGRPLQARLRDADDAALRVAGDGIGRALAAIHGITFAQAGFLDGALNVTPFPGGGSLAAFVETTLAGIAGERLGRTLAAEVVALAKASEPRLAAWATPPRLTHFDFGPSNILVREDFTLAAVLDWEFAASASPAADFGNLLRPPLGQCDAFVEALEDSYRAAGGALPQDWRALTQLSDIGAWAEFLSRPKADEALIADARAILTQTLAAARRG